MRDSGLMRSKSVRGLAEFSDLDQQAIAQLVLWIGIYNVLEKLRSGETLNA